MIAWFSGRNVPAGHLLAVSLLLGVSSCAVHSPFMEDEQAMQTLGSALTKLSSAVDVTVAYEDLPEGISDRELLVQSTRHDPELLRRFDGYRLRVLHQDSYAVLLVCSKTDDRALLEDVACTAPMDRHAWREKTPCEFTLRDPRLCD